MGTGAEFGHPPVDTHATEISASTPIIEASDSNNTLQATTEPQALVPRTEYAVPYNPAMALNTRRRNIGFRRR